MMDQTTREIGLKVYALLGHLLPKQVMSLQSNWKNRNLFLRIFAQQRDYYGQNFELNINTQKKVPIFRVMSHITGLEIMAERRGTFFFIPLL
ncbi:hypothetical protein D3C81_1233530 [compost metagenome]